MKKEGKRVNLTPLFEYLFNVSEIDNEEDLLALTAAMRQLDKDPRFSGENLMRMAETMQDALQKK